MYSGSASVTGALGFFAGGGFTSLPPLTGADVV